MVDLHRLRTELAVAGARPPAERARWICAVCVAEVPVTGAAVSLMADTNRRDILFSTDAHATELEELQFGLGEGPCVEAFSSGRPVLVADLHGAPDPRWPMFAAAATARTPARAAYAFPLQIGAIAVGILDLYRIRPGLLEPLELAASLLVADAVLGSLLDMRADAVGDDPGWPRALHHEHAVVYQATGMVIAQAGVSAEAALALLRAHAFACNRTLHEVAADVVGGSLQFEAREDT